MKWLLVVVFTAVPRAEQAGTFKPDLPPFINAERGLSIDQLVALALDQSPSIVAARARAEAARGERVQANVRPNPTLMSGWREGVGGMDRETMIGVNVPLGLSTRPGRVAVADSRIALAEREVAELERQVAALVRSRALTLLGAVRQLQVRERAAATLTQFRDLVGARAKSGAAPPLERDIADVDARRAEAEVLRQRAAVEAALAELRGTLGIPASQPLALREDLDGLRQARQVAVQTGSPRPDIQLAQEQVQAATATLGLIRRESKPDVDVAVSYVRMKSGYPLFGFDPAGALKPIEGVFHSVSIGASVTLPFGDRRQGDVAAATAGIREAEHTLEARTRLAAAEVQAAEARVQRLDAALAVYDSGLRNLAAQNVDVVRQSYELGRATLLEVLNETRRLLDTEMTYTELLIEALQARIDLASAMGAIR
jgi:cobalt-zinc-cadmium efflux system outer membrane protein